MVNDNLTVLRKALKRGDQQKIAKELGFSSAYVNAVLRGARENISVVEAAVKLAEEHKVRQDAAIEKISKL